MKVALCVSGHLGKVKAATKRSNFNLLRANTFDVFAYTSDAVSQKDPYTKKPIYKVHPNKIKPYLPAKKGWRKHSNRYGIIYSIGEDYAQRILKSAYGNRLKQFVVEKEDLKVDQTNMSKWDWLRQNQLRRAYACHSMFETYCQSKNMQYDIVIKSRFDVGINLKLNVVELFKRCGGRGNKVFVIGGWTNKKFMDKYLFDGFLFGNPDVMKTVANLYKNETPYPCSHRYQRHYERHGDNSEYQLMEHLKANNIEIVYASRKSRIYRVMR